MSIAPCVALNSGVVIPVVGLGVFQAGRGAETQGAVREALQLGYRHIDTARVYANEHDVGIGLRDSGVPRDEVFITTKLWNGDQGYEATLRACDASLKRLGLEYIDLYLVHWPVVGLRLDSWRALEHLLAEGRVRAIGVSNYMVHHLEELLATAKVVPAVNQIEVSPFLQQEAVRAFCKAHGIAVEAYSPLTKGKRLDDMRLADVARHVGKSPAQVLLRWGLQHGLIVLPKSTHPERIAQNLALFDFELNKDDMARLDDLEEGLVTGWDPRNQP